MKFKNPLIEIIFILIFCIAVFGLYDFLIGKPYKISDYDIKQIGFKKYFSISSPSLDTTKHLIKTDSLKVIAVKKDSSKTDSSKQTILLTGDSMSEGLMFPFIKYAKYNGHVLNTVIWYSSSTLWWSEKDSLAKLIKKYKPTFVIFTLGSNELFIRNIAEREANIQNIIKQAGNTKFIWIGPPNWKDDTGINDLLIKNLGKDRFFISKYLKFERAKDGRHPSRKASVIWADTISNWVMKACKYPIVLEKPKLPQENILGSWREGKIPFFEIKKDSIFYISEKKSYKYFFNGRVFSMFKGKQNYRANVLNLSKDSLTIQDHLGIIRLYKSRLGKH